jgi:hypothetical protein
MNVVEKWVLWKISERKRKDVIGQGEILHDDGLNKDCKPGEKQRG